MWAEIRNDKVHKIFTRPKGFRDARGILHPRSIFKSESRLLAVGVVPVEIANETIPPLHLMTGVNYEIQEGKALQVKTIEPLPLADAKALLRKRINGIKQERQDGVFEFNGSPFQCDERSRGFITGAALKAFVARMTNDTGFAVTFTDADNVDHAFGADDMIALGQAAAAHVEQWHEWAKGLKAQVEQAASIEELINIWESL